MLHHDEELTVIESKIVDGDDIGMREVRRGARLLAKALLEAGVVGIILMQDLDRDRSLEH